MLDNGEAIDPGDDLIDSLQFRGRRHLTIAAR
jgi:hypothetical protein